MDWLFEHREKSLANNAQRIVADMHHHLDREKKRNRELEQMVLRFQNMCTESLEYEIKQLELKKKDMIRELEAMDRLILEKKTILDRTREEVREVLSSSGRDKDVHGTQEKHQRSRHNSEDTIEWSDGHPGHLLPYGGPNKEITSNPHTGSGNGMTGTENSSLEQQYLEEKELLDSCREVVQNLLFMIHTNQSEDIVSYNLTAQPKKLEFVDICKVINVSKHPTIIPLLPGDKSLFDSKIIPNHDRDFPDARDLEVPFHLLSEKQRASRTTVIFGQLVVAFEIPIVPEVLIDVWESTSSDTVSTGVSGPTSSSNATTPFKRYGPGFHSWATTTIDNINFAVLERILITSETSYGSQNIVQIDLFGRHPKTGRILVESIVPA